MTTMPTDWAGLHHAYGPASDIPGLLTAARTAPAPRHYDEEPWFSLWSALYHQDDIYPASYAAVPELLAIAEARSDAVRSQALYLAALIELARHAPGAPPMPSEVLVAYEAAMFRAEALARAAAAAASDELGEELEVPLAVFTGDLARARQLVFPPDEDELE